MSKSYERCQNLYHLRMRQYFKFYINSVYVLILKNEHHTELINMSDVP